jgi:predicted GNAT family acetyltransferase
MTNEHMTEWLAVASNANAVVFDEANVPVAAARWRKVTQDTLYVDYVEVRLDARRQGWGKKLWTKVLAAAGEEIRKVIGVHRNEAAVRLRFSMFPTTLYYRRGDPVDVERAAQLARSTDPIFAVSFLYK